MQAGMHPRSTLDLLAPSDAATADLPTRDTVVDTKGGSAMPAPVRGVQRQSPGTDPNQRPEAKAFASDSGLGVPVIASPEEILRAREIREQLKKTHLDRPNQPCSPWSVGVD